MKKATTGVPDAVPVRQEQIKQSHQSNKIQIPLFTTKVVEQAMKQVSAITLEATPLITSIKIISSRISYQIKILSLC